MSTIEEISSALNITVRRVNQLAKEGILPREGRGDYNLGKCMATYIRYLQAALSKKATMDENGELSSLQGNRQELMKVQIERERFELAKVRSEFIPIEAHEKILSDLIMETKARVKAVGARVAPDLVGEESRLMIQAKLERAHDEALLQLSKVVPRIPVAALDGEAEPAEVPAEDKPAKKPKARAKAAGR